MLSQLGDVQEHPFLARRSYRPRTARSLSRFADADGASHGSWGEFDIDLDREVLEKLQIVLRLPSIVYTAEQVRAE